MMCVCTHVCMCILQLTNTIHTHQQLKNNIQHLIADYKDMCHEREDLLFSLADVSLFQQQL